MKKPSPKAMGILTLATCSFGCNSESFWDIQWEEQEFIDQDYDYISNMTEEVVVTEYEADDDWTYDLDSTTNSSLRLIRAGSEAYLQAGTAMLPGTKIGNGVWIFTRSYINDVIDWDRHRSSTMSV